MWWPIGNMKFNDGKFRTAIGATRNVLRMEDKKIYYRTEKGDGGAIAQAERRHDGDYDITFFDSFFIQDWKTQVKVIVHEHLHVCLCGAYEVHRSLLRGAWGTSSHSVRRGHAVISECDELVVRRLTKHLTEPVISKIRQSRLARV